LDSNPNQYLEFASKLKEESKLDDESWADKRRNILTECLSSESLMHTEGFYYPWSDKLHKKIQNNLLDELNTLPKTGKILSAL
jgi:predicted metal-dependent HD superfamily phosphohydrolase